jgi:hypothetical protein
MGQVRFVNALLRPQKGQTPGHVPRGHVSSEAGCRKTVAGVPLKRARCRRSRSRLGRSRGLRRRIRRHIRDDITHGDVLEQRREHDGSRAVDAPVQPRRRHPSTAAHCLPATRRGRTEALRAARPEHRVHPDLRRAGEGARRRPGRGRSSLDSLQPEQRMPDRPLEPVVALAPAGRKRDGLSWCARSESAIADSDRAKIPEGVRFAAAVAPLSHQAL